MKNIYQSKNGYIALISLIIIGGIVLIATITVTFLSISQKNLIISHNRTIKNFYSANACANYAILRLQQDLGYSGNEDIELGGIKCRVESVSDLGEKGKIIIVSGQQEQQLKKLKIELDEVKPTTIIRSWGEIFE